MHQAVFIAMSGRRDIGAVPPGTQAAGFTIVAIELSSKLPPAGHANHNTSVGKPGPRLHPCSCHPELTSAACRIYRRREYKYVAQGILKRAVANAARVVVGLAASSIGECSQQRLPCRSYLPLRCIPPDCRGTLPMSCVLGCHRCGVVVENTFPLGPLCCRCRHRLLHHASRWSCHLQPGGGHAGVGVLCGAHTGQVGRRAAASRPGPCSTSRR